MHKKVKNATNRIHFRRVGRSAGDTDEGARVLLRAGKVCASERRESSGVPSKKQREERGERAKCFGRLARERKIAR